MMGCLQNIVPGQQNILCSHCSFEIYFLRNSTFKARGKQYRENLLPNDYEVTPVEQGKLFEYQVAVENADESLPRCQPRLEC